jgi:hypothetical protein
LPTSDSNSERVGWPRRTLTWRLTSRCVKPVPELLGRGVLGALTSPHEPVPQRTRRELCPFEEGSVEILFLTAVKGLAVASRQTAATHKSRAEITLRVPRLNAVQSSRSGGAVNSSGDARLPAAHAHLLWGQLWS